MSLKTRAQCDAAAAHSDAATNETAGHERGDTGDICAQLDDIPLAIELAAARLTSLSIHELAQRLDDRFSLLAGGRSRRRQRQQTLQAMM